ncbi:hypothetical protein T4D_3453 [Trichinella pseudospiralis]|uniref:Uncharacterized protein n=1 Tax=Trichinella pseudospiralis TaxID=6337 RepID=A0A0V1FZ10_TRIPS|nr:hypothetical protein T4D_3453 [Trichinella pseudospiralis]
MKYFYFHVKVEMSSCSDSKHLQWNIKEENREQLFLLPILPSMNGDINGSIKAQKSKYHLCKY